MLPRLFTWLGRKGLPHSLRWKEKFCNGYKERPVCFWRVLWCSMGWVIFAICNPAITISTQTSQPIDFSSDKQTNRLKNTVLAFLGSIWTDSRIMSLLRSSSPHASIVCEQLFKNVRSHFWKSKRVRMLTWKLRGDCSVRGPRISMHFVFRHAFSINQSLQIHVRTLTAASRFNLFDTNPHISAMVFV